MWAWFDCISILFCLSAAALEMKQCSCWWSYLLQQQSFTAESHLSQGPLTGAWGKHTEHMSRAEAWSFSISAKFNHLYFIMIFSPISYTLAFDGCSFVTSFIMSYPILVTAKSQGIVIWFTFVIFVHLL